MLLLLDENIDTDLEALLTEEGLAALHVESLDLKSAPDPEIFRFALANGYDALVTKDAFDRETRGPVLQAMRDGLRIFQVKITPKDPVKESRSSMADLIFDHVTELEAAIASSSPLRHLILNMRQHRITKTKTLAEVLAELERLGG